jgi:hypothetical protein
MPVSTDDYMAVADHIARYCWRVDAGDADGWADLWTEDGSFTGATPEAMVGREALRQVAIGVKAAYGDTMCHMAMNIFCDYAGNTDTIEAHLYNYVSTWMPGAPGKPSAMARCKMTLVRSGSGWLVKRNEAQMLTGA